MQGGRTSSSRHLGVQRNQDLAASRWCSGSGVVIDLPSFAFLTRGLLLRLAACERQRLIPSDSARPDSRASSRTRVQLDMVARRRRTSSASVRWRPPPAQGRPRGGCPPHSSPQPPGTYVRGVPVAFGGPRPSGGVVHTCVHAVIGSSGLWPTARGRWAPDRRQVRAASRSATRDPTPPPTVRPT